MGGSTALLLDGCPAIKAGASDLVLLAYSPEADGFKGTEVGMSHGCEEEERRL